MAKENLFDVLKIKLGIEIDRDSIRRAKEELRKGFQEAMDGTKPVAKEEAQKIGKITGEEFLKGIYPELEKLAKHFNEGIKRGAKKEDLGKEVGKLFSGQFRIPLMKYGNELFGYLIDAVDEKKPILVKEMRELLETSYQESLKKANISWEEFYDKYFTDEMKNLVKLRKHVRTYQMPSTDENGEPLTDYRKMKFNNRLTNNLTDFIDDFFFGIVQSVSPIMARFPERMQMPMAGALARMHSVVKNIGIVSAKVGIIGVVLNKIYEVIMKVAKFSGLATASLRLLSTFVGLTLKPIADLIGVLLVPMLVIMIKALMPILRNWNKIVGTWFRESSDKEKGTQLLMTLIGLMTGNLWGGLAGALLPMFAKYAVSGKDSVLRVFAGGIAAVLGKVFIDKLLSGDVFFNLGKVLGLVAKNFIVFNKAIGVGVKIFGVVGTVVGKTVAVFGSLARIIAGGGGVLAALGTFSLVLTGLYALYHLIKGEITGEYNDLQDNEYRKKWMFDPFDTGQYTIKNYGKKITDNAEVLSDNISEIIKSASDTTGSIVNSVTGIGGLLKELDSIQNEVVEIPESQDNWLDSLYNMFNGSAKNVPDAQKFAGATVVPFFDAITQAIFGGINVVDSKKPEFYSAVDRFWNSIIGALESVNVSRYEMSAEIMSMLRSAGINVPKGAIPAYQSGGFIPENGIYYLHAGELVVPPVYQQPKPSEISINVDVHVDSVSSEIDLDEMADELAQRIMREIRRWGGV